MKKHFFIILIPLALIFMAGCNLVWDVDTTADISYVSTKPVMTLLGDPIISMQKGGSYTEAGVEAKVGDTILEQTSNMPGWEIIAGNVDPSAEDFYVVTYYAENGYGWGSYAYRAVLVHDGDPYGEDISGEYKVGNYSPITQGYQFETSVSKYAVGENTNSGYWQIDNVWIEEGVNMPIVFADKGDGTYGVVPSEHETKGRVFGTAFFNEDGEFEFNLEIHGKTGIVLNKDFKWDPK